MGRGHGARIARPCASAFGAGSEVPDKNEKSPATDGAQSWIECQHPQGEDVAIATVPRVNRGVYHGGPRHLSKRISARASAALSNSGRRSTLTVTWCRHW
jgi:hypothetical protein